MDWNFNITRFHQLDLFKTLIDFPLTVTRTYIPHLFLWFIMSAKFDFLFFFVPIFFVFPSLLTRTRLSNNVIVDLVWIVFPGNTFYQMLNIAFCNNRILTDSGYLIMICWGTLIPLILHGNALFHLECISAWKVNVWISHVIYILLRGVTTTSDWWYIVCSTGSLIISIDAC